MATVTARLERSSARKGYGTVYYRIYKGHNRRMEFSSRIHIPVTSWDETAKTVKGDDVQAACHRVRIKADLELLQQIIDRDEAGEMTMGDIINVFKESKEKQLSIRTDK